MKKNCSPQDLDLLEIVKRFSRARIFVVGDVMVDKFIWGKVSRISPEAPVPVVQVERETLLLGGAANVVNNVRSLGGKVHLCGVVGNDDMGRWLMEKLNEIGVGVDGIHVETGRQTTLKTRVIAHHQQVVRIDRENTDNLKPSTYREIARSVEEAMDNCEVTVLSDYGKGMLSKDLFQLAIRLARRKKKFILVDPKPKNIFFCRGATVVTPNTAEASAATGIPITDHSSLEKAGRALYKKLACQALVITRGEEGMAIFDDHSEPLLVPTEAKEVYDVTGAGDTAIGTMALALAAGADFRDAVRLANYAAGIVVGKMGTATVTPLELTKAIRGKR